MPKPGVRRIVLLTLGWEELPLSVSLYGAPPEERFTCPVPGVLLECDGGWLLLDTGFNPAVIRDPALYRRFFPDPADYRPILPPGDGDPLENALEGVGLALDDIKAVGVSHLHVDHSGGVRHFAGGTPCFIQARELEFGLTAYDPQPHAMVRLDYDDRQIAWNLLDGQAEIAPGVTAIPTYGHTPGNQSFLVELDESVGGGGFVFAFDAADLTANIEQEIAIGGYFGDDPYVTLEPIRRLKAIAAEKGYPLIPGHDPVVWPRLTEEMASRFSPVPA